MLDDDQLADILLDSDLIDRDDLQQVLDEKSGEESLYRALIRGRRVDERALATLLSELLNVSFVDVSDLSPEPKILELIPREFALDHETLPLELERQGDAATLIVAMSDPIDMIAMDEVASHTGIDIRPVLAGPRSLRAAINRCYDTLDAQDSEEPPESEEPPADEPGSIEDVDPTGRRPAPPPPSAQDDVKASVPGRPLTDSNEGESETFDLQTLEESAGDSDESDTTSDTDLPEEREPTRSELGRIAVERVAVSRDDVDSEGNLRSDALDTDEDSTTRDDADRESTGQSDDSSPERLTDPERRERLENLVETLDERSDSLLGEQGLEPQDDATSQPSTPTEDEADADPDTSLADSSATTDQFGLRLAELGGADTSPGIRDALASLDDDEVLKAAVAAMVDKGLLDPAEILEHVPSHSPPAHDADDSDHTADTDDPTDEDPQGNTDQGTGPTFPSFDDASDEPTHGLGQISSEAS